jgi:hypothetical protein
MARALGRRPEFGAMDPMPSGNLRAWDPGDAETRRIGRSSWRGDRQIAPVPAPPSGSPILSDLPHVQREEGRRSPRRGIRRRLTRSRTRPLSWPCDRSTKSGRWTPCQAEKRAGFSCRAPPLPRHLASRPTAAAKGAAGVALTRSVSSDGPHAKRELRLRQAGESIVEISKTTLRKKVRWNVRSRAPSHHGPVARCSSSPRCQIPTGERDGPFLADTPSPDY